MKKIFAIIGMLACLSSMAQNVGIGTAAPGVKLTVAGGMASTPATAVAASSVTIPSNTSVFYLTATSGTRTDALTMAAPTPGQYLTIYNLDGNAATFAGYTITASTGVMTFQYINSTWQAVSDNSYIGSGSYIKNQTSSPQTGGFDISGNGLIGGTLGIGGISPSSALQVAGSTGGLTDYGILTVGDNATNNNGISMGYDATNNWAWLYARTHNVVGRTIDINNNLYATWGGGVGIGTSTPISTLQSTGTMTVGPYSSAGAVGMAQITTGGSSPISNRLTYGTDGTGWKFAISKNQGGTVSDQMIIADNGTVQISNLAASSGSANRPVYTTSTGVLNTSAVGGLGLPLNTTRVPFAYSGSIVPWTVPTGVSLIYVKLWGGGGGGESSAPGGAGGFVSGYLSVTAGTTYYILVGGGGSTGRANAYGGGGAGTGTGSGASGGGRSAIMSANSTSGPDVVDAGGGGGGARDCNCYGGGGGGGLAGGESFTGHTPGQGGTQSGGGAFNGSTSNGGAAAGPYTGGNANTNVWGGGGGGGYYGGAAGGGTGDEGPGGGGSSYVGNLLPIGIINMQGAFNQNNNTGTASTGTYYPYGDNDWQTGVGTGGAQGVAGGNGYVVIYY